jgi:hypothetical protein
MLTDNISKLQTIGLSAYESIKELIDARNIEHESQEDADAAYEAILEDALSVEVREDWHPVGQAPHEASKEYRILLSTGGPATQIVGELNKHNEPTSATLQAQDWFLPWTNVIGCDEAILLEYAQCFYFGE